MRTVMMAFFTEMDGRAMLVEEFRSVADVEMAFSRIPTNDSTVRAVRAHATWVLMGKIKSRGNSTCRVGGNPMLGKRDGGLAVEGSSKVACAKLAEDRLVLVHLFGSLRY